MIHIEIPDDIVPHLWLPPGCIETQLKQELAIHLVRQRICTATQGARLAEMTCLEFERLLGGRKAAWLSMMAEVQRDLEVLDL